MRLKATIPWAASVAVVVMALAAVVALTLAAGAPTRAHRLTVLQFNICGNACNDGGLAVVAAIEQAIGARSPSAATLNEVCENQYARLRADLVAYHGRFDPTGPRCHNGDRYGNAVLVRAPDADLIGSWGLPNPAGDETRRLMCLSAHLAAAAPVAVCVTHISSFLGNVADQVRAVAGILGAVAVDHPVILGGDFNTDPADARMDPLYSTCYRCGAGEFREADSPGCTTRSMIGTTARWGTLNEGTYGRHKYDDIFLSKADWSWSGADAVGVDGLSDHEALWAAMILRG